MQGRTLKLFLVDGSPTGVITAELGGWNGKVLVAPRSALPELIKRPEAQKTGAYLLTGPDPEATSRTLVYVGEGDAVKTRLVLHDGDDAKQFCTRICLIVAKDQSLTKAHARYLESRLIKLIKAAARARPVNRTEPKFDKLPESDIADMERFLHEVEVLLPAVGFDLLRTTSEGTSGGASPTFESSMKGISAEAQERGGEFVVLADSRARLTETNACPDSLRAQRKQLIEDGALAETPDGNYLCFMRDVPFGSPSGAASVIYGGNSNGRKKWTVKGSGVTYGEWRERCLGLVAGEQSPKRSTKRPITSQGVSGSSRIGRHASNADGRVPVPDLTESPVFEFSMAGISAQAQVVGDDFVVLNGSNARATELDSCSDRIKAQRKQLLDEGVLVELPDRTHYRFACDAPFGSSSAAAQVLAGGNANGPRLWRVKGTGVTLAKWSQQRP